MYVQTLRLKLRVLLLMKLLTHNNALYSPTLTQCRQQIVLVRATCQPTFSESDWESFCRPLIKDGRVVKSTLALSEDRARLSAKVRKRPASAEPLGARSKGKLRKRTPFTLKRVGEPYKKPSAWR